MPIHQEILDLAIQLARDASEYVQPAPQRVAKKSDNSPVTAADLAIQRRIIAGITEHFPDHAVIAEEARQQVSNTNRAEARFCWVIDPLDGTRNYVLGFPCYATSIGVLEDGVPVAGAIYDHNLGQIYAARKGNGAQLDGRLIQAADPPSGDDILLSIPSSKDPLTRTVINDWIATPGYIIRSIGSTALQLALVASGALAASFCTKCRIWDVAAGILIAAEAGADVAGPSGSPLPPFSLTADHDRMNYPVLAAAPQTHRRLIGSMVSNNNP